MRIKASHLPAIFAEVQRVRTFLNQYCGGPDKTPVSLDDITTAISEIYGVQITTQIVPFGSSLLKGMIEIYEKTAIVTIDAKLNTAETRYVFVKEACHIMLLSNENATKDPAQIVDYYVHVRPEEDDGSHPNEIICEEITKFGAYELLFPPPLRQPAKVEIVTGTATLFTIGEGLHVPIHLVDYVLSDWYMELSARLRDEPSEPERFGVPRPKG
jgi:hypothetical protein